MLRQIRDRTPIESLYCVSVLVSLSILKSLSVVSISTIRLVFRTGLRISSDLSTFNRRLDGHLFLFFILEIKINYHP